jgi:hypothetical protein
MEATKAMCTATELRLNNILDLFRVGNYAYKNKGKCGHYNFIKEIILSFYEINQTTWVTKN